MEGLLLCGRRQGLSWCYYRVILGVHDILSLSYWSQLRINTKVTVNTNLECVVLCLMLEPWALLPTPNLGSCNTVSIPYRKPQAPMLGTVDLWDVFLACFGLHVHGYSGLRFGVHSSDLWVRCGELFVFPYF